jgi:uncharacterized protein (TIGR02588 family)
MTLPRKNFLEWTVFAIGLLLVLTVAGLLVWDAATAEGGPPILRLELGVPQPADGRFLVPVAVRNLGAQSAEGVQIEVVLDGPGGHEEAGYEVAFVPRRSERRGWVVFRSDPRGGRLEGRVLGYEHP